nr:MAG TPA: hypothetical protein [Caudoviricetes sp.]
MSLTTAGPPGPTGLGGSALRCPKNPAELGAHGPRKTSASRGDFLP